MENTLRDTIYSLRIYRASITLLFVLLLAMSASCATVRVYSEDTRAADLVASAGDTLGVRTVMVQYPSRGAVVLRIEKTRFDEVKQKQLCGTAEKKVLSAKSVMDALENGVFKCRPEAWACPSEEAVAHELGHVFGLNHTSDGLMAPVLNGDTAVTDKQKAVVNATALALEQACWGK